MSLYQARMPSLREKLQAVAQKIEVEEKNDEKVEEKKVTKGRRLNK